MLGTCKMAGGENQDYLALCCHTFGLVLLHYHSCQMSDSLSGLLTVSRVAAHVVLTFPSHPSRNLQFLL